VFFIENLVFRLKDVTAALIECHVARGVTPLPADIVTPFGQRTRRRIAESVPWPCSEFKLVS
jgi:hypothetical protein